MSLSVNVTMSMPPEMVTRIDEQREGTGMSRSEYIRRCIRDDFEEQLPVSEETELGTLAGTKA